MRSQWTDLPALVTGGASGFRPQAHIPVMTMAPLTSAATSSSNGSPTTDPQLPSPPAHSPAARLSGKKGRRQRACLSCVRCHRLKVKCDKGLPCARCCQSGFGRQCEYTHRVEAAPVTPAPAAFTRGPDNPERNVAAWHFRPRGSSNWRELVTKAEALVKFIEPIYRSSVEAVAESLCVDKPLLPINFPFSSVGAVKYTSLEAVCKHIYSNRRQCLTYVDYYMVAFQPMHPIVNATRLQADLEEFWKTGTSEDASWLGELCMILALGSLSATVAPEAGRRQTALEFCLAAESCLSRTAFMVYPTVSTVRTMTLILVVKQLTTGTCWSIDNCWTLAGLIFRQAATLGLHCQPAVYHECNPDMLSEWQNGQTLWVTLLYFGVLLSITSGLPSFLRADELLPVTETFTRPVDETEGVWQSTIRNSFPAILKIIGRVNSDTDTPTYEETLEYNAQIRHLMLDLDSYQVHPVLRIILDMHFRRVLLVLHRRHALQHDAPYRYPESYWSSLECSLAILVHHREMYSDGLANQCKLMCRFFMLDFFAAALTAGMHLLRHDAPLADGMAIPPRQTIFDTLVACTELWARERPVSACYRSGHELLQSILSMLSSS